MTIPAAAGAETPSEAYDAIDRYLRNNMDDADYATYSALLDSVYAAAPQQPTQERDALTDAQISAALDAYYGMEPTLRLRPWQAATMQSMRAAIDAARKEQA